MDEDQSGNSECVGDASATLVALLTEEQVAAMLGKPKRWLQQNRHRGRDVVPYVKVGRTVRYEPDAVARYVERNRFTSTSNELATKSHREHV